MTPKEIAELAKDGYRLGLEPVTGQYGIFFHNKKSLGINCCGIGAAFSRLAASIPTDDGWAGRNFMKKAFGLKEYEITQFEVGFDEGLVSGGEIKEYEENGKWYQAGYSLGAWAGGLRDARNGHHPYYKNKSYMSGFNTGLFYVCDFENR